MLGVVEDAEDLVQETYLRWQQADAQAVRAPERWLVAVITRRLAPEERAAFLLREVFDCES